MLRVCIGSSCMGMFSSVLLSFFFFFFVSVDSGYGLCKALGVASGRLLV